MKNITLSADGRLIELAREKALRERRTLNVIFRDWLRRYVGMQETPERYRDLMQRFEDVSAGRHFSRDELNER